MQPALPQKSPYVEQHEPGTYLWCRCGRSAAQPFCDGSHAGTGMAPIAVRFDSKKTIAWCGCKRSKNAPYCDGTHSML